MDLKVMRVGLTDSAGLTHAVGILPVLARFVSRWIYELMVENDTSDEQKAPLLSIVRIIRIVQINTSERQPLCKH